MKKKRKRRKETIVIALGGNALVKKEKRRDIKYQQKSIEKTIRNLSFLLGKYHCVFVHGSGFQIGELLLQNELARSKVPVSPLDVLDAETQGELGYLIEQAIINELQKKRLYIPVVSILSQVIVDKKDPAFKTPSKPIGLFYNINDAGKLFQKGYIMINDAGKGYRRVVPSPRPLKIVEAHIIRKLVEDTIVIAAGGGGIPVVEKNNKLIGVEAVIDKDLSSALLGKIIKADILLIVTDVDKVYLNYRKKDQEGIQKITMKKIRKYVEENHFETGSMKPKIEAALDFLQHGGKKVIITSYDKVRKAMNGKKGTIITR